MGGNPLEYDHFFQSLEMLEITDIGFIEITDTGFIEITDTSFVTTYKCEMARVLLQVCWPTLHQCGRQSRRFQGIDFVQSTGSSYADR